MYPPTESSGDEVGSLGVCSTDGCRRTWAKPIVSEAFSGLVKFVSFAIGWAVAIRLLLWPIPFGRVLPGLSLCGIALGLVSLVVFNRWRLCRELRELAWEQWIDSVSPIARRYGIESAVVRLSDRWRGYFEQGLSPERAVSRYKSDYLVGLTRVKHSSRQPEGASPCGQPSLRSS